MLSKHHLDRGVSKAELSRRFGVNRRTIHYWIGTGQPDRDLEAGARGYSPRPPVAHKLDPHRAIIDARLESFPKLSAKQLSDEVCAADYPGGCKRVQGYVRVTRPREPVEPAVRFETPVSVAMNSPRACESPPALLFTVICPVIAWLAPGGLGVLWISVQTS